MTTASTTSPLTDTELVQQSLAGNHEAFGQIVARHQSLICSVAYSATGSLSGSRDLAQDTFVAAWQQLPSLREPARLRGWLCGIARHLISSSRRRTAHEPAELAQPIDTATELAASGPLPADEVVSREEEAMLWHAIGRIPEIYREPLILFYREHHSIARVADALDIGEDAVKQRLSRGRALLQEQVLAMVEGTLARSRPGEMFTAGVLAALPSLATATVGAAAAKTTSQAAATGLGSLAAMFGAFGLLGGITGHQMSDTARQSAPERASAVRFWRLCAIGFAVFVVPALGLIGFRQTYPWVADFLIFWLGAFEVLTLVFLASWAWRHFRRVRQGAIAAPASTGQSNRRFILPVAIATVLMAAFLAFTFFADINWHQRNVSFADAKHTMAEHPGANVYISEYQNGMKMLAIVDRTDGKRMTFFAPLRATDEAAVRHQRPDVKTLVQGRDFEILGWPGRMFGFFAVFVFVAGVVALIRLRKSASVS
jgi:RNA polymerase sigma factor (sigma-70 family)